MSLIKCFALKSSGFVNSLLAFKHENVVWPLRVRNYVKIIRHKCFPITVTIFSAFELFCIWKMWRNRRATHWWQTQRQCPTAGIDQMQQRYTCICPSPSNPFLASALKIHFQQSEQYYMSLLIHCKVIYSNKNSSQPKCPSIKSWLNKFWCSYITQ